MAITMQDVRVRLEPEEVDYAKARRLGTAAIPFLMELVQGGDLALASKAAYLASLIRSEQSVTVLEAAAASSEPVVRVAAASGLRNLSDVDAERLLGRIGKDPDVGVRKMAVQSVSRFTSPQLTEMVQKIAEEDPEPLIRELATNTTKKMK